MLDILAICDCVLKCKDEEREEEHGDIVSQEYLKS